MGNISYYDRDILAFTHIKKAAGTTLIHILRSNYFLKYCDVKPLILNSDPVFKSRDMIKLLKVNPFIRAIGGHSVVPYGDLQNKFKNMKFITLMRDPIKRYISQYQHNIEKLNHTESFLEFLENKTSWNKQVRTIAGSEDLEGAKNILKKNFLLVGIVEEFDEFLILLKRKLQPLIFQPGYRIQNIGMKNSPVRKELEKQVKQYREDIQERNLLDIDLYHYVKTELIAENKRLYGSNFLHDLYKFKNIEKNYNRKIMGYLDYIIRKIYYRPLFWLIRRGSGFNNNMPVRPK